MSTSRYELKFVLDATSVSQAMSWLYNCTTARAAHPPRTVNSVYFDDPGYSSVRDNLAGISKRRKIRLRWYHNENRDEINGACLEVKHRNGRLGSKDKYLLPDIEEDLLSLKYRNLFSRIQAGLGGDDEFLVDDHLSPTLHVSYRREYFEGLDGVRVTFDHPITFYSPFAHTRPFEGASLSYPHSVMEVKFPIEQKEDVATSFQRLNLTPKRHSKYLAGLAGFGQVLYY